jgi:glutaredoxin
MVSQYLKSNDVKFEEIEITPEIQKELVAKGLKTLPVLDVNGELKSGLSKKDLDELIKFEKGM